MPQYFRPDEYDPDPLEEEELEPPAIYFDRQIARVEKSLEHNRPTDPDLVAKLERELDGWKREKTLAALAEDWTSAGDRALF